MNFFRNFPTVKSILNTYGDISASSFNVPNPKLNFEHINDKVHIIFKSFNLEKQEQQQQQQQQIVKPSYYDFVIMVQCFTFYKLFNLCALVQAESINHNGDINNPEFGIEYSGIISRIGNNVTNFKIGDQVYGMGKDTIQNCSTHATVDSKLCYRKPTNISYQEAASTPCVYLTSLSLMLKKKDKKNGKFRFS
ncbi:hypothetical protein ACTA71_002155 [Dictyostelium dimigraforme]